MAEEVFANQPSTTISSGGTDAPVSGTSQTWTVASSATFPAASATASPPTQFHVVDAAVGESSELVLVTNVSGTTWTVTRGAESTTPITHTSGFTVQQIISAGFLNSISNPMTSVGDTTYGGTSGALTRLAGNSTAVRKFLRQLGTGSASAAPVWDSLTASDLPAATTSAQGAVELAGDLAGTAAAPTVAKIQGTAISTPSGTTTTYLNGQGTWTTPAGGGGGSAGGAPTAWFNVVTQYGASNTGASDCHTAVQSAITAAAAATPGAGVVYFPAGVYLTTGGWTIPGNVILQGDGATGSTVTMTYTGTVIRLSSSFAGGTYSSIFNLTDAGHTSAVNGPIINSLMIDGHLYTGAAVDGIRITGPVMTSLNRLVITQMYGWGINTIADLSANEIGAFGQIWDNIVVDSCHTGGINLDYAEDSTFLNCYVIGCAGPGWQIEGTDNSHFIGCRAEYNTYGYWITGANAWTYAVGYTQFTGCSTDRNSMSGVRIDGTWQTGQGDETGPCGMLFTNLVTRRDGSSNGGATGSYAGIDITGTNLPVIVTGFGQMTGDDDGGGGNMSPRYGIFISGVGTTVPILITSGIAWGYTAGVQGTATGLVTTAVNQQTGNYYSSTI